MTTPDPAAAVPEAQDGRELSTEQEAARQAVLTDPVAMGEDMDELRTLWKAALEREGNLASAVADVIWKATQYGETEDGDTYAYIVPKGTMHRLAGVAQSNGAHIPVAFRTQQAPSAAVREGERERLAVEAAVAVALNDAADQIEANARYETERYGTTSGVYAVVAKLRALAAPSLAAPEGTRR